MNFDIHSRVVLPPCKKKYDCRHILHIQLSYSENYIHARSSFKMVSCI